MSTARTIRFEGQEVVKRFRHARWLSRRWDGARAKREARILRRLAAAGVQVPELIDIGRVAGGWEVRMRLVPEAVTLEQWLERNGPDRRLLAKLGGELARIQQAGVALLDLHPGNVLVTPDGEFRWIDFHGARDRRPIDQAGLRRDLVRATSFLLELVEPDALTAGFGGWWNGLAADLRRELGSPERWMQSTVAAGRHERRAWVEQHLARWQRPSGRLTSGVIAGQPGLIATNLDESGRDALAQGLGIVLCAERAPELWNDVCRAFEHRVAVLQPLGFDALGRTYYGAPPKERAVDPSNYELSFELRGRAALGARLRVARA